MKNRAFTLIEVLVSVVLLGLISVFVSSSIYQTKKNDEIFAHKVDETLKVQTTVKTLYKDILESSESNIVNYKDYAILYLRSRNSIYGISTPYIVWLVRKEHNTLTRLESAKPLQLPIDEKLQRYIFVDPLLKNCNAFQVNLSKKKNNFLLYLIFEGQKPIIFEVKKL